MSKMSCGEFVGGAQNHKDFPIEMTLQGKKWYYNKRISLEPTIRRHSR